MENEALVHGRPEKAFLCSPRAYFKNLAALKTDAYSRSLLARSIISNKSGLPLPFPDNHVKLRDGWQESFTEAELESFIDAARCCNDIETAAIANVEQYLESHEADLHSLQRRAVECRNALFDTCCCLRSLERTGFLVHCLSVLVLDVQRPPTINMIPIDPEMIYDLAQVFHKFVGHMEVERGTPSVAAVFLEFISAACNRIMQILGLPKPSQSTSDRYSDARLTVWNHLNWWRNTVRVLDLAAMSYIGAHIDDTMGFKLDEYRDSLQIQDDDWGSSWLRGIHFQRRRLQCLSDALNNSEVWVFNLEGTDTSGGASYLATKIRTLADIWGPVWRPNGDKETTSYYKIGRNTSYYNIGGGSIVPWSPDSIQHPVLKFGERLAHWVPYSLSHYALPPEGTDPWQRQLSTLNIHDSSSKNPDALDLDISERATSVQPDDPDICRSDIPISSPHHRSSSETDSLRSESIETEPEEAELYDTSPGMAVKQYAEAHPFDTNDSLLVGAGSSPKLQNYRCRCSVSEYMHHLKEMQCLHPLETSKLFYYVDSRMFNMSVGYNGWNIGAGIALKKQDGRMWKQVLLEIWENQPSARHPKTLEHFWGVFVSKCNSNSQRTRLIELLGTDSIHQLLKPFAWSKNEVRNAFLEATTSGNPFALSELWDREAEWQEELGKVLLTCLRALCQTGYDSSREEFYALWMSSKSTRPKRVVLKLSEHSWVRLLQDSEDACGLAVLVKECLSAASVPGPYQRCERKHASTPSRLETSLVINHEVEPYRDLVKRSWNQDVDSEEWLEEWRSADRNWKYYWDVSKVEKKATFWIVPRSRLKTSHIYGRSHLALKYDRVKRDALHRRIGVPINEKLGHWEYTEDEEHPPVRPIPVHIVAD